MKGFVVMINTDKGHKGQIGTSGPRTRLFASIKFECERLKVIPQRDIRTSAITASSRISSSDLLTRLDTPFDRNKTHN